jgi:S1-C subfamily serine protease
MRATLPATGPFVCAALASVAFGQDESDMRRDIERRTRELQDAAAPAVVSISVTTRASRLPRLVLPGVVVAPCANPCERIEGTGFFIASRGLLVTTRELVADAARIEIRFFDGSTRDATVAGTDDPYCMAVLRTSPPEGVATLPHSQRVEATDSTCGWFFGASPSASGAPTVDVQFSTVRPAPESGAVYDRFLYTPTSLARGAAGGPLVGSDGLVLGMAVGSLVSHDDEPGVRSAPARATLFLRGDDLADAALQIAATGSVERPMMGVVMQGGTNRVETVVPGSPAEAAGLTEGDAIVAVGCTEVATFADLTRALLRRRPGDRVRITAEHDGARFTRGITLVRYKQQPDPTTAPFPGAILEVSTGPLGETVLTFVDVKGASAVGKAGVVNGDRLLSVDGRPAWRFLSRHRAHAADPVPTTIEVDRAGERRRIGLPSE